jgi:hypothetical protein
LGNLREEAREADVIPLDSSAAMADDGAKHHASDSRPAIETASRHLLCDDRDLANAIDALDADGFSFHSTQISCLNDGTHMFLLTGVRQGIALPRENGLGTWFNAADRNEALQQFNLRLAELWPAGQCEFFFPSPTERTQK